MGCRRGGFTQSYSDRCWGRVMAASCSGDGAAVCSDSDDHIRQVAGTVALKKVEAESNLYTLRRPDYSAEEWRFLYLTTSTDLYLNSIRLVGFCGAGGINWAIVTRMRVAILLVRVFMVFFRKSAFLFCITCGHSFVF